MVAASASLPGGHAGTLRLQQCHVGITPVRSIRGQLMNGTRRFILAACAAAIGFPSSVHADEKPVRALFVLVGAGGHNVEVNTPPLLKTIEKVGGITVTLLAPPKGK